MASDLKKEFDELQKKIKEQKEAEASEKGERHKPIDELRKESEEATKKHEEQLKKEFQDMKKQKTSLDLADIVADLKTKSGRVYMNVKTGYAKTAVKFVDMKTKVQEMKDKYQKKAAKPEGMKTQEKTEGKEESKEEGIFLSLAKESKPGIIERNKQKIQEISKNVEMNMKVKMPRTYEYYQGYTKSFKDLWRETFPNKEDLIKAKMERVKKIAKEQNELEDKMKTMTEEEIKKIQESIPEYMRNALIVKAEEKKEAGGIWGVIADSEAAKQLRQSKEYKEYIGMKQEIKDIASSFTDQMDASNSSVISGVKTVMVSFDFQIRMCYNQAQKLLKRRQK